MIRPEDWGPVRVVIGISGWVFVMARDRAIRGVRCRNCGHDTRLFSSSCGRCGRRKTFSQSLPAYLAGSTMMLALLGAAFATVHIMR
ncbi:hypothetical protein [Solirhodobacter olei]|uniref:hypothetical protein n=1 Tax=Solirhodobacter olei TaxID=2493082 RepID=UPI000FD990F6|nr:hypothetical protein [Solirhodobacter olei]